MTPAPANRVGTVDPLIWQQAFETFTIVAQTLRMTRELRF